MGMSIDLAINNLSGILTEATENENSVCYVTEDDAETLQVAIDTMRKYQKIEEIYKDWFTEKDHTGASAYVRIGELLKDGNVD